MKTLKPFQLEAVKFLTGSRKHFLLADMMGLGKTISTIGALNELEPSLVLIVCPAAIKHQWERELAENFSVFLSLRIINGRKAKIPLQGAIILNYDLLTSPLILSQLTAIKWDVVVLDEVHYCKSMDAKRTKAVFGRSGLIHRAERTILLTGTPVLNRPIELFPILKVLAPDVLGKEDTYEKFGIKFCQGWFDGGRINVQGASNEDELNRRLKRSGFMLRRTESDVFDQLPQRRVQVFTLDTDGGTKDVLERLERHQFSRHRFEEDTPIATLRRELAVKKTKAGLPILKDIAEQSEKLVVFAYHKEVINLIMAEYPGQAVRIDGSCSQAQRQNALLSFQIDPAVKLLVGQITAAGQGLDGMQNVCSRVLFMEISWTPAEVEQAIARVARMGQKESVLVQFIIWDKSVESHMMRTILDKTETINKLLN